MHPVPDSTLTPSSSNELQRLRDILTGDELSRLNTRLDEINLYLERLRRDLFKTFQQQTAQLNGAVADQGDALRAEILQQEQHLAQHEAKFTILIEQMQHTIAEQLTSQAAQIAEVRRALTTSLAQLDEQTVQLTELQHELEAGMARLNRLLKRQQRAVGEQLAEIKQLNSPRSRPRRTPRRSAARTLTVDENTRWAQEIAQWAPLADRPQAARQIVRFFQHAFEWLPEETFPVAWFGVHLAHVSLTVGTLVLASVSAIDQTAVLLTDRAWDKVSKQTAHYVPLGWKVVKWRELAKLNRATGSWPRYQAAAAKVWSTPAARTVIKRNLAHKRRLSSLLKLD